MFVVDAITSVHLEITNKCNAQCVQCHRNMGGALLNPDLPLCELTIDDVQRILPPRFISQLSEIKVCGGYGDAIVAKDTLAIFEYFRSIKPSLKLALHTNGSGRDDGWWRQLAASETHCFFAIDGLSDTNALYRRGTDWATILRSVRSFTLAGGNATWTFIAFEHNEHQVEEARMLSVEFGFKDFLVKRTSRFYRDGKLTRSVPTLTRKGESLYSIAPPRGEAYKHEGVTAMIARVKSEEELENELQSTQITCRALQEQSVYISSEGLLFPCCYLGAIYPRPGTSWNADFKDVVAALPNGKDSLSLKRQPIAQLLEAPLFTDHIPESWNPGNKRLSTCAQTCGTIGIIGAEVLE